jgi:trehalose 6-phosphate synthase
VHHGRVTHIWASPVSIDTGDLAALAGSPEVAEYRPLVQAVAGEKTIVRVDRLDPSKNVLRGFQAFDLLLMRRPDLIGRVKFLAFLVPSRTGIAEYDDYARSVFGLIDRINARYGTATWKPIEVFYEQNRAQALAGLEIYDVLLVNPVADGMNLVSKEGPVLNLRNGVVCLSKTTGSYGQLAPSVLAFDPLDVRETASALEKALETAPEARQEMAEKTRIAINHHQLSDWLRHLLQDIELAAWKGSCLEA